VASRIAARKAGIDYAFVLDGGEPVPDPRSRITPITDRDAKEMIRSIKRYRLLEGYRGHPSADIEAIEDLLLRVSRLVEEVPGDCRAGLKPGDGSAAGSRLLDC
jgi:hypothetical protein